MFCEFVTRTVVVYTFYPVTIYRYDEVLYMSVLVDKKYKTKQDRLIVYVIITLTIR